MVMDNKKIVKAKKAPGTAKQKPEPSTIKTRQAEALRENLRRRKGRKGK
jgi:hypothetical protein